MHTWLLVVVRRVSTVRGIHDVLPKHQQIQVFICYNYLLSIPNITIDKYLEPHPKHCSKGCGKIRIQSDINPHNRGKRVIY